MGIRILEALHLKRMHRYCKYFFCLVLTAVACNSCSLFHGASGNKKSMKETHLTPEESRQFKSTYYNAEKEKIVGDYDQALTLFKLCITIDPSSAAANFEIADILDGDKHSDSALYFSRRAAELEPQNIWFQDLYAQCLQQKGDFKGVANIYRNIIKNYPDNAEYYAKLGTAEMQAGENEAAIQTFNLMEKKFGFNEDAAMNKIRVYEKIKNYKDAELEIEQLIKINPSVPEYDDMLANLYELQGNSDKAKEMYNKIEAANPHDPMVHLSLADYYRSKRDESNSFRELELAFKEPALDMETKIRILISFYEESDGHDTLMSQGLKLCKLMIDATPDNPIAHNTYGNFLFKNKQLRNARDQYAMSLNEDSSKYSVWSQLLLLDDALNDYKSLAVSSKSALNIFPGYPQLYLENGVANIALKNYNEALSSLNQGLQYVLDDTAMIIQFYTSLGDLYNAIKRYPASDSAYNAVLALDPNNSYVLNNYSYYLSLRDTNLEKAAEMSKKANILAPLNANYEDTYAWICFKMGKYMEAKAWQEGALRDGGDKNANILEHYGDILYSLGEKDKAIKYWQEAVDAGASSTLISKEIRDRQYYTK